MVPFAAPTAEFAIRVLLNIHWPLMGSHLQEDWVLVPETLAVPHQTRLNGSARGEQCSYSQGLTGMALVPPGLGTQPYGTDSNIKVTNQRGDIERHK